VRRQLLAGRGGRDQLLEVVVDELVSGGDPLVPYVARIRREYGAQRQLLRPAQVGAASSCSTELFPTNSGYAASRRALQVIDLKSRNFHFGPYEPQRALLQWAKRLPELKYLWS
jgi:hypothetical protein